MAVSSLGSSAVSHVVVLGHPAQVTSSAEQLQGWG